MTRIDFYLLQHADVAEAKTVAVCRLANKAYHQGRRIYIFTENHEDSQALDRLLWTYHPGTFVPHGLKLEDMPSPLPVLIGHNEPPADWNDVLITIRTEVPSCFSRFERVAEVVDGTNSDKCEARERYRFYRERGYPLQTHSI